MSLLLRFLALCLLTMVCLASCKHRHTVSDVQNMSDGHEAWFLDANTPLKVCLLASETVQSTLGDNPTEAREILEYTTWRSYFNWIYYLAAKDIQPQILRSETLNTEFLDLEFKPHRWRSAFKYQFSGLIDLTKIPRFPIDADVERLQSLFPDTMLFVQDCGDANLEVHFGTKPLFAHKQIGQEPATAAGSVYLQSGATVSGRARGAIVLADHSERLSYQDHLEAQMQLTHEFGHVFGVPHVPGTIMDPEEVRRFFETAMLTRHVVPSKRFRQQLFAGAFAIDRWRELSLCQSTCVMEGIFLNGIFSEASISRELGLDSVSIPANRSSSMSFPLGADRQVISLANSNQHAAPTDLVNGLSPPAFQVSQSENQLEIFKKPARLGARKYFHESRVVNRWVNRNFLIKAKFNGNLPGTPPVQIVANCQSQSQTLFRSRTFNYSSRFFSLSWLEPGADFGDELAKRISPCRDGDQVQFDLSTWILSPQQREEVHVTDRQLAQDHASESWLIHPRLASAVVIPEDQMRCGRFLHDQTICIWRQQDIAILTIRHEDATQSCLLNPVLDIQDSGSLEAWHCSFAFKRHIGMDIRIGLQSDIFDRSKPVPFVIDFAGPYFVWLRVTSGVLH